MTRTLPCFVIKKQRNKQFETFRSQFDQTSLGLPTRDYFLQPSNAIYLEAYKNYLTRIAILLGASSDNANIDAEKLIEFETQLASARITVSSRCLFHDVIIDLESRRLHRHQTKGEIFPSSISE